jgi:hypothetical protein
MTPGNGAPGNGKPTTLVLGIVTTLGVAICTSTLQTVKNSSERIAVLESRMAETRDRLERIERKVDQILDRHNPHGVNP